MYYLCVELVQKSSRSSRPPLIKLVDYLFVKLIGGSCTTYYVQMAAAGGPSGSSYIAFLVAVRFGLVIVAGFESGL